jgi:phosphatidate phosphatase PAH1
MNLASGQEVIDRSPQEFKIACLSALASLFSSSPCPYYAGKRGKKNGKATTTFISLFSSSPCPYYLITPVRVKK